MSITLSPTRLPAGNVNVPYSIDITATGGTSPYTFSVSAGQLPRGLALTTISATQCRISGRPTFDEYVNFTIGASDTSPVAIPGVLTGPTATYDAGIETIVLTCDISSRMSVRKGANGGSSGVYTGWVDDMTFGTSLAFYIGPIDGLAENDVIHYQIMLTGVDGGIYTSGDLTFTAAPVAATALTLTGPGSGTINVASTNFTVAQNGAGTTTFTPTASNSNGSFTPSSLNLSGTTQQTFTYTPTNTGARNINGTNTSGLTAPTSVSYTSTAAATRTDTFTRTASNTTIQSPSDAGGDYTLTGGVWGIDGGTVGKWVSGADGNQAVLDCGTKNQTLQVTFPLLDINLSNPGLVVRSDGTTSNFLVAILQATGNVQIVEIIGGAGGVTLKNVACPTIPTSGDVFKLTVDASHAVTFWQNGAHVVTADCTTALTGTYTKAGIRHSGVGVTGYTFDTLSIA